LKYLLKDLRFKGILVLDYYGGSGVLYDEKTPLQDTLSQVEIPLSDHKQIISDSVDDFINRRFICQEYCFYFKSRKKEYLLIDDEDKAIILFCITDNKWMKFAWYHSNCKSLKPWGFTILPATVAKHATHYFGIKLWNNLAKLPEPNSSIHQGAFHDTDDINTINYIGDYYEKNN